MPTRKRTTAPASQAGEQSDQISDASQGQGTGRYLIVLREGATKTSISAVRNIAGVAMASASDFGEKSAPDMKVSMLFDELGIAVCNADPDQYSSLAAAAADEGNADILAIEPELICSTSETDLSWLRGYRDAVNDLYEHMTKGAGDEQEAAEAAAFADESRFTWGLQAVRGNTSRFSGRGIKLAVLDTGFDLRHPDFVGRSVTSRSFIAGQALQDGHGHGTHCIGTACGPQNPSGGRPRYGLAFNSRIFAGKVLSNQGRGPDGDILRGINWAVANRCEVISMSLGAPGPASAAYETAGLRALNAGSLIIAAAGNDSRRPGFIAPVSRPANSQSIMAVGALDRNGRVASFSCGGTPNGGGKIDIAAPGVAVLSSAPGTTRLVAMNGTSMATPHVAGVAALLAEARGARGLALKALLTQTARPLPLPSTDVGSGLVQAPQ